MVPLKIRDDRLIEFEVALGAVIVAVRFAVDDLRSVMILKKPKFFLHLAVAASWYEFFQESVSPEVAQVNR